MYARFCPYCIRRCGLGEARWGPLAIWVYPAEHSELQGAGCATASRGGGEEIAEELDRGLFVCLWLHQRAQGLEAGLEVEMVVEREG